MSIPICEKLEAIDEEAMYQAPASTHATVNEAAAIIEALVEALAEAKGAMNEARVFAQGCEPYNSRESVEQDKAIARYDEALETIDAALSRAQMQP